MCRSSCRKSSLSGGRRRQGACLLPQVRARCSSLNHYSAGAAKGAVPCRPSANEGHHPQPSFPHQPAESRRSIGTARHQGTVGGAGEIEPAPAATAKRHRRTTTAPRRAASLAELLRAAGPRPVGRAERSDGLQEGCLSAQRSCVRPALLRRCTAGGFPCGCMAPAALLLRVVRRCARWHCFAYCAFYIFTRGLIETIITI